MEVKFEIKVVVDDTIVVKHEIKVENSQPKIILATVETAMAKCQEDCRTQLTKHIENL